MDKWKVGLFAGTWATVLPLGSNACAQMTYLDNGTIKLGINLDTGGAITFLGQSNGGGNLVFIGHGADIQQAYYSIPAPYDPNGTQHPGYIGFPWNPVQAGDAYRNMSQVLEWTNDGSEIYSKTQSMQYAMNNYPADYIQ